MKKASKSKPAKSLRIANIHKVSLIYGIVIGLVIGLAIGIPMSINYSPPPEKESDANGPDQDHTPPAQPPEIPPPGVGSIGFEGFLVDDSLSGMEDGIVTLVLENAGSGSINVKKATATYLDKSTENVSYYLVSSGDRFSYSFDFSEYLEDQDFWIDFEVLYDSGSLNEVSTGSLYKGISDAQVSECQSASFEVPFYYYYVGRGVLSLDFRNTGSKQLTIHAMIRDSEGRVSDIITPFILEIGERLTKELSGLTGSMQSLMFVSEECPGLSKIIMIDDIAGL